MTKNKNENVGEIRTVANFATVQAERGEPKKSRVVAKNVTTAGVQKQMDDYLKELGL